MSKNDDKQQELESGQSQERHLSRTDFLKVATAGVLGAAGLALSFPQTTFAAKEPPFAPPRGDDDRGEHGLPRNDVEAGLYVIQSRLNGYVLDIRGGNTSPGARIIAYPLNTPLTPNQVWYISADGYIVSALNGYVLDISGASTAPATPIISYPRNSPASSNQRWRISRGYIISELNGYVLDIYGGNTAPGTQIISYPRNTPQSLNQQWNLRALVLSYIR
ncbi:hypothetical protein KDA_43130 [Dictyobacter alpinus]|uniref:Ricin B lectin domain-containing protein n=1 Tax=Dictyobacter alpinus TaxID=2014873 RepID=A0A402BBW7_9CHLR|nr:RICIN domain-containing protein [Dictyobacter alpinus]GCE28829.1 hypothetical protein KDA_43130 [Dictyobacter alpinus]